VPRVNQRISGVIMSILVERLFSSQSPKTTSIDPDQLNKSTAPTTGEDKLLALGQVQHREPMGSIVLDAQIGQNTKSRAKCVAMLREYIKSTGRSDRLSFALAEVATTEVCDCPACRECHGTGTVIDKEDRKLITCKKCNGFGRYIPSQRELHQMVCHLMPGEVAITRYEFNKKHYDVYMDAVDVLNRAASDAGRCAKQILEACA